MLLFVRYLLGMFDSSFCDPNYEVNEVLVNETSEVTNVFGIITGIKCSNVPGWVQLLIYVPFIVGVIYLLFPIPFRGS
jgi:hypothetical protein